MGDGGAVIQAADTLQRARDNSPWEFGPGSSGPGPVLSCSKERALRGGEGGGEEYREREEKGEGERERGSWRGGGEVVRGKGGGRSRGKGEEERGGEGPGSS